MTIPSNYVQSQSSSVGVAKAEAIAKIGSKGLGYEVTSMTGYERNHNLVGSEAFNTYARILNNNSTAWALYYVQYVMMQQVEFFVKPGKNKKSTQILEASLRNIKQKWLLHKASLALPFGYSLVECLYDVNEKGQIVIKGLGFRPQSSIASWGFDEQVNSYVSAFQEDMFGARRNAVEIPLKKCLHFRLSPGFDESPEGRSQLRTAVRPFQYIETIQETEAIGIDRDLTGIPKLQVPMEITLGSASAEEQARYAEAKKLVASVRQGQFAGLVLPSEKLRDGTESGWKFEVVTSGGSKLINTNEIVKRYEVEILMLGLFEVLILGMQGKPGSNALASEQTTFGAMAIGTILGYVIEEMNRQRDFLMELNGISKNETWAEFAHTDIEKLDFAKVADFINKLPGLFPENEQLSKYCHELINLPFDADAFREAQEEKKKASPEGTKKPDPNLPEEDSEPGEATPNSATKDDSAPNGEETSQS